MEGASIVKRLSPREEALLDDVFSDIIDILNKKLVNPNVESNGKEISAASAVYIGSVALSRAVATLCFQQVQLASPEKATSLLDHLFGMIREHSAIVLKQYHNVTLKSGPVRPASIWDRHRKAM